MLGKLLTGEGKEQSLGKLLHEGDGGEGTLLRRDKLLGKLLPWSVGEGQRQCWGRCRPEGSMTDGDDDDVKQAEGGR